MENIGYSDSDFTGCLDSRRSATGYIFMLAGRAISLKSDKQMLVTSTMMAVKFIACFEASDHGIWLQNFVTRLHVLDGIDRPLKIYCDNKSAVFYSNNNTNLTKSMFVDIKYLVVKERVHKKEISTKHIRTNSMLADLLTKGLAPKVFHEHNAHSSLVPDVALF